jgi:hypothetical protein
VFKRNRAAPATGAVQGIVVLEGTASHNALARLREESAGQLRRRRRPEAIFRRGGLRPILKLLDELIRHDFATVELPIGLKLIDCAVFVGTNGAWARPPAKPQLDKDGRQRNHCFACGAHGEVIEFLRRYDNPDCGSAVVKLASALAAAIREQRSVIAAFATAGGPS